MESKSLKNYLILGFSVAVILIALRLVYPFIVPILGAVVSVLALYPVYKFLVRHLKYKTLCASILVVIVIALVVVPSIFFVQVFFKETHVTYLMAKQKLYTGEVFPRACEKSVFCDFSQEVNKFLTAPDGQKMVRNVGEKIQTALYNYGSNLIFTIPRKIVDIFIFLFVLFYLLRDGDKIISLMKKLMPLSAKHQEHLFEKTKGTVYGVLYGTFLIAIIQGVLSAILFYLLGFTSPVFWAVILFIVSVLPVGTWLVWAPMSVYLVYQGVDLGDNLFIWKGMILFILGVFVFATMDNILKPWIISNKVKTSAAIIILGILGGIMWFGFVGFFVGPIILVIMLSVFDIYIEMSHKGNKIR